MRPGGMIVVWFCQVLTILSALAAGITVLLLRSFIQEFDNLPFWEDEDNNPIAPMKVKGDEVLITKWQNYWLYGGCFFFVVAVILFFGMIFQIRRAKRSEDRNAWGEAGHGILIWSIFGWIAALAGAIYIVVGFLHEETRTLNNNFIPDPEDGMSLPESMVLIFFLYEAFSALYALSGTLTYCVNKSKYDGYGQM